MNSGERVASPPLDLRMARDSFVAAVQEGCAKCPAVQLCIATIQSRAGHVSKLREQMPIAGNPTLLQEAVRAMVQSGALRAMAADLRDAADIIETCAGSSRGGECSLPSEVQSAILPLDTDPSSHAYLLWQYQLQP